MHFGRLNPEQLDPFYYKLPEDSPITEKVLRSFDLVDLEVRVGCTKWGSKYWIGQIYPTATMERDFLREYVKSFNSIELNTTFYNQPTLEAVDIWLDKSAGNPDFQFCPKFPRQITHLRRLNHAEEATNIFFESLHRMGSAAGPAFLQLPESFGPKRFYALNAYLENLPRDYPVFVEIRNPAVFNDAFVQNEYFDMLRRLQFGSVISDGPGRRDCLHMTLPNPHAFIRFVGNGDATDAVRLDDWVERISKWRDMGLQTLYFFMHQQDDVLAPKAADYFIAKLNDRLGLNIMRPKFV